MPDAIFDDPRLAAIYDALAGVRDDLDAYLALADELGGRRVLDVGCGTGTYALLLAQRGLDVVGLDPASASLAVARAKPGAERVRWIQGDARSLPSLEADLATMTGNVAQAIVDESDWSATLGGIHEALRPSGHLVFETRDPAFEGWREWDSDHSFDDVGGVGTVENWSELTSVALPLVSFRWTFRFPDGEVLTSDSTLRFREREEVEADLASHGFDLEGIREAPDRPGKEFVFVARRTER